MLYKRFALLALVFGFIIAIGVAVKAGKGFFQPDPSNAHLHFISDPEISCNIDGKWFHHYKVTKDNKPWIDFRHEEPRAPKVKIEAEAHGLGWAYVTLSGDVDGEPFGDPNNPSKKQRLGFWISVVSYPRLHNDYDIVHEEEAGKFDRKEGEYEWTATGSIKLVPYIWRWRLLARGLGGEWQPAPDDDHTEKSTDASGSWTVKHHYSNIGSESPQEDDDDDDDEMGDATVPDRPGSFDLTPQKYAIKVTWTDSASDGGSPITDYQYQWQANLDFRRTRWTTWSDWTSAGTGNSTWINNLDKNRSYAVRMRAVNAVGNSIKTGIKIVKTKE